MTPLRRALYLICFALCATCMAAWLANLLLMAHLSTAYPEPATSHIDQWNNHGAILYRTPGQSFLLIWAWVSAFVFGLVGNTIKDRNWWRTISIRRPRRNQVETQ